jgi:hypothetical protein
MPQPRIGTWLARFSDPLAPNPRWPADPFEADDERGMDRLLFEARRHSVNLVFYSRLIDLLRLQPDAVLRGDRTGERAQALLRQVSGMRLQDLGQVMAIAAAAREIRTEIAGLPAVVVKGLDFAEVLFGGVQQRSFGDVDLLYDPRAEAELRSALCRLGFTEHRPELFADHYTERQWVRPHPQLGQILVELHTDLVHTERLRQRISLPFGRYVVGPTATVTPAARLILAAVHAATSHLFGRLQYVVDGLMAARAEVDPVELAERAREVGAVLPLRTLLRLVSAIFPSEQAGRLLDALPTVRGSLLEARLITPEMVLAAKGRNRWRFIPQRRLYRRLLRL